MTIPLGPHTAIVTYTVTADQLFDMNLHFPALFVSENQPQRDDEHGWLATLSRRVSVVDVEFGTSLGGSQQISVEFEDGTPGRVFDPDETVDVHMIWPGRDLIEALGGNPPEGTDS